MKKQILSEEFKRMQKLAGMIKLNEVANDKFIISFTPEPLTTTFYVDDFDDETEFQEFKNQLKSDEILAYKTFFDNFNFDSAMDYQNEDNWKIEIK
jgi:hypothetical protein